MPHLPDAQHPDHDLELVAAYAAGDATGPELERANALVSTCAECAALHHDLRAIAAALPELPAPVRSRDFRLTPDQAASLRPSGIRGLLATLSGPKFSFATPLGTGLAAIGIVGVLVASGGLPTGGGTAADGEAAGAAPATPVAEMAAPASEAPAVGIVGAQPAESPAASTQAAQLAPAPSDATLKAASGPADEPTPPPGGAGAFAPTDTTAERNADGAATAAFAPDPLAWLAAALVFLGAALVAARLVARRLARAP